MTPAEANLHAIAAAFGTRRAAPAPVIVRVLCRQCSGCGFVVASSWQMPQLHLGRCTACAGKGSITKEAA